MKTASQSELLLSSESEKGASAQSLGARCRVITNLAPACAQMLGRAAACLPPPERSSEAGASVSHACPTNWPAQLSVCCACLVGAMTGRSALCGSFRRRVRQAFVGNRPRRSDARYRALGRCRCNFRAAERPRGDLWPGSAHRCGALLSGASEEATLRAEDVSCSGIAVEPCPAYSPWAACANCVSALRSLCMPREDVPARRGACGGWTGFSLVVT